MGKLGEGGQRSSWSNFDEITQYFLLSTSYLVPEKWYKLPAIRWISCGDLMYSMVDLLKKKKKTALYIQKLLKEDIWKSSHHKHTHTHTQKEIEFILNKVGNLNQSRGKIKPV